MLLKPAMATDEMGRVVIRFLYDSNKYDLSTATSKFSPTNGNPLNSVNGVLVRFSFRKYIFYSPDIPLTANTNSSLKSINFMFKSMF